MPDDDSPGRIGGSRDRQPGSRHRHPHGDRDGGGRNAGAAAECGQGEDRRQRLPAVGRLGRLDDSGRRIGIHAQIDDERAGEAVRGSRGFARRAGHRARGGGRKNPGEGQPGEEPGLEGGVPEARHEDHSGDGRERAARPGRADQRRRGRRADRRCFGGHRDRRGDDEPGDCGPGLRADHQPARRRKARSTARSS